MKVEALRSAMAQRSPLAGAVWAFNFGLAADLHPERLPDGAAGAVARRALATASGVRRLSQNLAWVLGGVHPAFCFAEFEDPVVRVALGRREPLNRLVFLFGLAVCRKRIARTVAKEEVRALRGGLGEEGRAFAMRRAAFLISDRDAERFAVPEGAPLTADTVWACGFRGVAACVAKASSALVTRLRLKFPPSADSVLLAGPPDDETRGAAYRVLRRIANQEAPEAWAGFFN